MPNRLIDLNSLETGVVPFDLNAANGVIQDYLVDVADYDGNFTSKFNHEVRGLDNMSDTKGLQVDHSVNLTVAVANDVEDLNSPELFLKVLAEAKLVFNRECFNISVSRDEASGFIIYLYRLTFSTAYDFKAT